MLPRHSTPFSTCAGGSTRALSATFVCSVACRPIRAAARIPASWTSPRARAACLPPRLESMPSGEYQRLIRLPAPSVRKALVDPELDRLLGDVSDEELAAIVSDVGGHDLGSVLGALDEADHDRDRPVVILAHTIKGWGLPIAADPLNHTALLTAAQVEEFRTTLGGKP